jgi:type II secretory pathway component PulK
MKVSPPSLHNSFKGIALVSVLAVLTILSILAVGFTIFMVTEINSTRQYYDSLNLDLLVANGLSHAKAEFASNRDNNDPAIELQGNSAFQYKAFSTMAEDNTFGSWRYVHNDSGELLGRYRIRIEDEAAKLNLNKAYLLDDSKGWGWDTSEITLPPALGISKKGAERIVEFKYGDDLLPGTILDDDRNNAHLVADGLDNNANGIIDEEDEGVNDPREYVANRLTGNDRSFTCVREVFPLIMGKIQVDKLGSLTQRAMMRKIAQRATLHSIDMPGSPTLPTDAPSDLNCLTVRECTRRLRTANEVIPFESNPTRRKQLAANIIDYRDENHVLSTIGSTYGIESICFNEVMANDASSTFWLRDGTAPPELVKYWIEPTDPHYWRDCYGSLDGRRPIYTITFAYFTNREWRYHTIDPIRAWRVAPGRTVSQGSFKMSGSTVTFKLPPGPGKRGSSSFPELLGYSYMDGAVPDALPGGQKWNSERYCWSPNPSKDYTLLYKEVMKELKKRGQTINGHAKLPNNLFKNSHAMIYAWAEYRKPIGCFEVVRSSQNHEITVKAHDAHTGESFKQRLAAVGLTSTNIDISVSFDGWGSGMHTMIPRVSGLHMFRPRNGRPGEYYKVQIMRDPIGEFEGYEIDTLGVSGDPGANSYDREDAKLWDYKGGQPMKADEHGWVDVVLASSPKVSRKKNVGQSLIYLRLVAPEVAEMYNASDHPISLANWRVICNTGSLATKIGHIRRTAFYDRTLKQRVIDDNPIVAPRGHFYLVNDTRLFDARYGNADFLWGSRADEQVPVFQMDERRWGVSYKIAKVERLWWAQSQIYVKDEHWKPDMFRFETAQFLYPNKDYDSRSWHGAIVPLMFGNEENSFKIWTENNCPLPEEDGEIVILGLPYQGGIVSLTLKNEYDQVCARTVEYGTTEPEELGYSSEKIDPTQYTWHTQRNPTIGKTENLALNTAMRARRRRVAHIKNGPYGSVAEIHRVRTADSFTNVGSGGSPSERTAMARAMADVFCTSHIRLEACDEEAEVTGWDKAVGVVTASDLRSIQDREAEWIVDQWKGHTLRFTSGPLRGESFPIAGNTRNILAISHESSGYAPRSAPGRNVLKPQKGSSFSIGPGYKSSMCYTRKSNQSGEWLWRRRIPVPGRYGLYIYGLNDAIDTTEFLEENYNAAIDVEVWNYKSERFDLLCERKQYGKEDCISVGIITPDHISSDGDFRIRLTAHDLVDSEEQNGKGIAASDIAVRRAENAWFNYAVITPVPVEGRINVNTAPARLLASVPGITPEIAANIEQGLDNNSKAVLKPYRSLGDLLLVKDLDVDRFERCANMLTVDSNAYTVEVEAQTLNDKDFDGKYDPDTDAVHASRNKRFVMQLGNGSDNNCTFRLVDTL